MRDELSDRQHAIRMRLAGDSIPVICQTLRRSDAWVRKWWQRYLTAGGEGLYDLTRARHTIVNRTPVHSERAILGIRRRLAARSTPQTRYAFIGAPTIQQELKLLRLTPLPTLRTIERVLQRAHLTSPRLRLAARLPQGEYPGPHADDSNQVQQVDLVGPRYLRGSKTKYYFFLCKDAFDQAVYAEFPAGNAMEQVLPFLVRAWQHLGLPPQVQFDNGRQFYAPGRYARSLNRVIRLALRVGVQPVFIPEGQPQRNGAVENFNAWFQPVLLRQDFPNVAAVRREVRRLVTTTNEQHVHQRLGFKTPQQFRRSKRFRRVPANFALDLTHIPVTVGKVVFIRWVLVTGYVDILGESVKVGRRYRYRDVKAILETHPQRLKVYCHGQLIKQCPFKLRIK